MCKNILTSGLADRSQTGVIAQEVQKILPDAVSSSGPYLLNNGELIDDLLIVDKDRLFFGKTTSFGWTSCCTLVTKMFQVIVAPRQCEQKKSPNVYKSCLKWFN